MPERHLILHLGSFKTGSTAIQRAFAAAGSALAAAGVVYPGFASNHGLVLYPDAAGVGERIARHPYGGIWTDAAARRANARVETAFAESLANLPASGLVILSGEHFGALDRAAADRLVQRLSPYFHSIRALVYLRAPTAFACSMAQQLVRDGASLARVQAQPPGPQYRAVVEPWDLALGRAAVDVRLYQPHTDPVRDFCAAIGRPDLARRLPAAPAPVNAALSADAIAVIDRVNRRHPGGYGNPQRAIRIAALAARLRGPRFVLDAAGAARVRAASAADRDWLSTRLGHPVFGADPLPTGRSAPGCDAATLERLARRMNDIALRRQHAAGRHRVRRALRDGDEDAAWEGIPLLAQADAALEACAALRARGWPGAAREAAAHALRLAPHSAAAAIAHGELLVDD